MKRNFLSLNKKAFSIAEALVALLIGSIILGLSAPMISKQLKHNNLADVQAQFFSAEIEKLKNKREVPVGTIVMWGGTNIPSDWALCDGTKGTPDLRDRFIVGAGSAYSIGNTGGTSTVKLTEEQMPEHKHLLFFNGRTDYNPWGNTKN